jgi:putative Holliday junction resolvase
LAHPVTTFRFAPGDYRSAKRFIYELCVKEGIIDLALGYPLHMSGQESERSESSKRFKKEIEEEYPQLRITLVDERMTTLMANKLMMNAEIKASKRHEVIDTAAAMLILETYLRSKSND